MSFKRNLIIFFIFNLCILSFYSSSLYASQEDKREAEVREKIENDLKKMREAMDQAMGNFDQFDKIMERFQKDFFNDHDFFEKEFDDLFKQFNDMSFQRKRFHQWGESSTHRILTLFFEPVADRPFKIDVKDGKVTIEGETEGQQKVQINGKVQIIKNTQKIKQTLSIPKDVEPFKYEVKQESGKILILFPKLKAEFSGPSQEKRVPVQPKKGQQVI